MEPNQTSTDVPAEAAPANHPPLSNLSRRRFLELVGIGVPVAAALAACSSSGPSQAGAGGGNGGGGGGASYWFLNGQPQQAIREDAVKAFNAKNPKSTISYTEFQNDAYKTKVKTAIGAGKAPTIIWGWGGGGLRSYVRTARSTTSPTGSSRTPR